MGTQNIQQIGNLIQHTLVIFHQLVLLHGSQTVQTNFQDGLGLLFGESIALVYKAEILGQTLGPASITANTIQQLK